MKQIDPIVTAAGSPTELSPDEVQSRLREAARILVNGAIRVITKHKRRAGQASADEPAAAPARKSKRSSKRTAMRLKTARRADREPAL